MSSGSQAETVTSRRDDNTSPFGEPPAGHVTEASVDPSGGRQPLCDRCGDRREVAVYELLQPWHRHRGLRPFQRPRPPWPDRSTLLAHCESCRDHLLDHARWLRERDERREKLALLSFMLLLPGLVGVILALVMGTPKPLMIGGSGLLLFTVALPIFLLGGDLELRPEPRPDDCHSLPDSVVE